LGKINSTRSEGDSLDQLENMLPTLLIQQMGSGSLYLIQKQSFGPFNPNINETTAKQAQR
jgi:hypothetical protein